MTKIKVKPLKIKDKLYFYNCIYSIFKEIDVKEAQKLIELGNPISIQANDSNGDFVNTTLRESFIERNKDYSLKDIVDKSSFTNFKFYQLQLEGY